MKHYTLGTDVFNFICKSGAVDTRELVRIFATQGFSKQGVYKALRQLAHDEKILLQPKTATVNYVWLIREIRTLSAFLPDRTLVHETYTTRRVYKMKTLNELDAVYAQIFVSILMTKPEKHSDALFYDLHNYTYLHKVPLVDLYVELLNKKFEQTCLLVGSESPLDKALKKKMHIPIHLTRKRWNTFIAVMGDYVIYNHVDPRIWKKIDRVFEIVDVSIASIEIQRLAEERGSYRIVVERSVEKSEEIRRVFGKYFVLGVGKK